VNFHCVSVPVLDNLAPAGDYGEDRVSGNNLQEEFPSVVGFLLDASGISVNAIEGSTQSPVYVR